MAMYKRAVLLLSVALLSACGEDKAEQKAESVEAQTASVTPAVSEQKDAETLLEEALVAFYAAEYARAFAIYETLAEQGNARAMARLGNWYEFGIGRKIDEDKALAYYQRAAEASDGMAMFLLANFYRFSQDDDNKAQEWFDKALPVLQKAAAQQDSEAQFWLGVIMYQGIYSLEFREDAAQAVAWFRAAAEQGHAAAQFQLAEMYAQGIGGAQNDERARYWYQQAAEQNDPGGLFALAEIYREGKGVPQDAQKAAYWQRKYVAVLQKAAEQGHTLMQYSLAEIYREGENVPQDLEKARYWYEKSAEQGWPPAQEALKELSEQP